MGRPGEREGGRDGLIGLLMNWENSSNSNLLPERNNEELKF